MKSPNYVFVNEPGSMDGFQSRHDGGAALRAEIATRMRVLRLRVHTCLRKGIRALRNKYTGLR